MKRTALSTRKVKELLTSVNRALDGPVKHWWVTISIDGSTVKKGTDPSPKEDMDKFIDVKFLPVDKRVDENQVMHEECFVHVLNHIARYRQVEVTFFLDSAAPRSN